MQALGIAILFSKINDLKCVETCKIILMKSGCINNIQCFGTHWWAHLIKWAVFDRAESQPRPDGSLIERVGLVTWWL